MRFHRGMILVVVLLFAVAMVAGCSGDTSAPAPQGGGSEKVQGEGYGFNANAPIKVEVTLSDGKITAIDILEHEETAGVCDPAFEQIPQAIIDAQSTSVDAVSGATMTSEGIMEAVANATGK